MSLTTLQDHRYPPMQITYMPPVPGSADARALELFQEIATEDEVACLYEWGVVRIPSKLAPGYYYLVTQRGSTLYVREDGVVMAHGCMLIVSDRAKSHPPMDHMIAVYLVLKSREDVFWRTARITSHHSQYRPPLASAYRNIAEAVALAAGQAAAAWDYYMEGGRRGEITRADRSRE